MVESELESIIGYLHELEEDTQIPKNVRTRISEIIDILKEDTEISMRINKAQDQLEDISNDTNLQSFTRTQIWNVQSLLESLE